VLTICRLKINIMLMARSSIFFHHVYSTFVVSIFYSLHFPPMYQKISPKLHLHFAHNIFAYVVFVPKLQIPCTYKVWIYSHWLTQGYFQTSQLSPII
jgi:hypothetical protein